MSEYIAVDCETREEWGRVQIKKWGEIKWPFSEPECINMRGTGTGSRGYYIRHGYTIITAQEYLKKGEEVGFKIGDEVVFVDVCGNETIRLQGKWHNHHVNHFKLFNKTTNQTKEKDMSININETVAKVFPGSIENAQLVTKHVGNEYEESNHRAYMALRDNSEEVLKYCQDCEAEEKKALQP